MIQCLQKVKVLKKIGGKNALNFKADFKGGIMELMKILVIEDNRKHMDDAIDFFEKMENVVFEMAYDYRQARAELEKGEIDGVISDIYFPYNSDDERPGFRTEEPIGVGILMLCREKKIPCILNTSGYHHGSRYQWIFDLLGFADLPFALVDSGKWDNKEGESESKNLEEAFGRLQRLISEPEPREK